MGEPCAITAPADMSTTHATARQRRADEKFMMRRALIVFSGRMPVLLGVEYDCKGLRIRHQDATTWKLPTGLDEDNH